MLHAAFTRRQALSVRAQSAGSSASAPPVAAPTAAPKKPSLFTKLGGRAGVEAAVRLGSNLEGHCLAVAIL